MASQADKCAEPHHNGVDADERSHRLYHWKERLTCMGLCTLLHIGLEALSHWM